MVRGSHGNYRGRKRNPSQTGKRYFGAGSKSKSPEVIVRQKNAQKAIRKYVFDFFLKTDSSPKQARQSANFFVMQHLEDESPEIIAQTFLTTKEIVEATTGKVLNDLKSDKTFQRLVLDWAKWRRI